MTDVSKSKFGITEETKSKNLVPFNVSTQHPINQGLLTKVALEEVKKKDETTTHALMFYFEDASKERNHRETEWLLDETDAKFTGKLEALQSRIKHIYEEFAPFPKDGIGTGSATVMDFYKAIEIAFNTNGKDGSPIYTNVPVYIKLTWYKGNLKFPYSPNFIEKIRKDGEKLKPTNLVINPKYDVMDNDATSSGTSGGAATVITTNSSFEEFPN